MTVASAFFMEGLDSTIVGTSLPQIARSMGVTAPEVSSAITSYLLSLAVFIPISGWIADRLGARRVYCAAILLFTAGSLVCGLAHTITELVLSRILQGLGGALMVPVGRLILARSFPRDQLIRAMGFMIVPGLIGPMIGPVVGGFITTVSSWRWIFLVNVPVGLLGVALAVAFIRPLPTSRPPAFDLKGFLLVGIGFVSLQLGLERLEDAGRLWALFWIVASAAAFLIYAFHCRRHPSPVLEPKLLRIRTFTVSMFAGGLSRLAAGAGTFLLPLLFQLGFGYSPLHSGLLTFVLPLGSIAMRVAFDRALNRLGIRNVLIMNAVSLGAILAGFGLLPSPTPDWLLIIALFLFGLFQSSQFSTLGALNFSGLSSEMTSRATSFSAVVQRFSMSMGIALAAVLLSWTTGRSPLPADDFRPVFLTMAVLQLGAIAGFLVLRLADGDDLLKPAANPNAGGQADAA